MVRFQKEDAGYIMALRVMPPFQRLGIARQLMAAIEAAVWQNGYAVAQLNVAKGNAYAKRLYKKLGYRVIGELAEPWHYTTPDGLKKTVAEVEWVMQKLLSQQEML
jgi:ribosomal protein S18 acetylase RimI-like enzyme